MSTKKKRDLWEVRSHPRHTTIERSPSMYIDLYRERSKNPYVCLNYRGNWMFKNVDQAKEFGDELIHWISTRLRKIERY